MSEKLRNGFCLMAIVALSFVAGTAIAAQDTVMVDTIWCQSTWTGGPGQMAWSDTTRFYYGKRLDYFISGELSLAAWEQMQVVDHAYTVYSIVVPEETLMICGTDRFARLQPDIFRFTDSQGSWSPTIDYPVIDTVHNDTIDLQAAYCLLLSSTGTIYAGGFEYKTGIYQWVPYVLKSADLGVSWSNTGVMPLSLGENQSIWHLMEAPDGTLYAGTSSWPPNHVSRGKVYKSTDEGDTWLETDSLAGARQVWDLVYLDGAVYAATNCGGGVGKVFKSTNGGSSWDTTSSLQDAQFIYSLATIGDTLFAGTQCKIGDSTFAGLFLSTNAGLSWESPSLCVLEGANAITELYSEDNTLYIGTSPEAVVWRYDGSECVKLRGLGDAQVVRDIVVHPSGTVIVATGYGSNVFREVGASLPGFCESSVYDTRCSYYYGTMTWDSENEHLSLKVRTSSNKEMISAVEWDGGECDTVVNGQDISGLASVNDGDRYIQYRVDLARVGEWAPVLKYVCIEYSVPFDTIPPEIQGTTVWTDDNAWFGGPYDVTTTVTDNLSGVDRDKVYFHWSDDDGQTESVIPMSMDGNTFLAQIEKREEADSIWYYIETSDLRDNSAVDPPNAPADTTYQFWVVPQPPRFWHTTHWPDTSYRGPYFIGSKVQDASLDPSSVKLHWRIDGEPWDSAPMLVYPGNLYIGKIEPDSMPEGTAIDYYLSASDFYNPSVAGTDPAGAPGSYYTFVFTRVLQEKFLQDHLTFNLFQNSPNPFRFSSAINYDLPVETEVSLKVYDAAGRIVTVLVDDNQEPGRYVISWDRKDSLGNKVPSGVYFCRMETQEFSATRKMVVVQ